MGLLERIVSAANGAWVGWSGYSQTLTPHRDVPYGDYNARRGRYGLAEAYFYNTVYDELSFATRMRIDERLYKFIRGIYNPVERENNLTASYTYNGSINTLKLNNGAMPLSFENKALEEPLKQVLKWSNLSQQLGKYVSDAALLGDTAWWIVDDPARRRVRLELLDPARIRFVERDEVGNVRAAVIEYEREEEPDVERYRPARGGAMLLSQTKTFTFTLKVDKDQFQTFKDGKPFAFYEDENGDLVTEWDNPYGFVPLKLAYYAEGQEGWGRNSFFGTARRQINELNDQASIINDSIRKVVVPLLAAKGVTKAEDIKLSQETKDSMAILYLTNPDATIEAIQVPLDLTAATTNRNDLLAELESNMPVLALAKVRDLGGNPSGVAIENMFGDAISRINQVRKNLDPPLAAALQMAVTIGAIRGYDGFAGFNADSFDNGDMELHIADRPVIDDRLTKLDRLNAYAAVKDYPPAYQRRALTEMDIPEDEIDAMVGEAEAAQEAEARNAVRGLAQHLFPNGDGQDSEGDNEDPEAETKPVAEGA